jgi:prepilin-type N-terminal cleavage/methylation domain-containing protein
MIFNKKTAFTLIEILVSLTILSIIMVSVLFIFMNSTNLSAKSEINRVMQENIKNVIETISEDIRNN